MGGSGASVDYGTSGRDTTDLRRQVRQEFETQEFFADVNQYLGDLLSEFNDRDTDLIANRLNEIIEVLDTDIAHIDRLLFGGSVAKHTFVNGLSDVDALVILKGETTDEPARLVGLFRDTLSAKLSQHDIAAVEAGHLAATVTYQDGSQIQLLPAVEKSGRIAIPSEDGGSWNNIRPRQFAEKLTQINQDKGRAVVPTIKLAKSLLSQLPSPDRLSGYHVEAIAVDAFRRYDGPQSRQAMLQHLLEHASNAVMKPTGDITGQSVHIDRHLGTAGSADRRRIGAAIRRIASRMRSATSVGDYKDLFGDSVGDTLF